MADSELSVGTLSGRIELEDKFGPAIAEIASKLDLLNEKMGESHHGAVDVAEGFFGAEAAIKVLEAGVDVIKEGLHELFIEGSHIADIERGFEHLTEAAGISGEEIKSHMTEALHGLVDEGDLMTRVNQNLAVGLNLSTEKMDVLAKGSYALAKVMGGDAKEALDRLSDAMVTGRVRSIQLLTGKIDLKDVEEAYAESLGTTSDRLDPYLKQQAIQEAILKKVEENTGRLGEQQLTLADRWQQSIVVAHNFMEELGRLVSTSPVLEAGFDAIRSAIGEAFGGREQDLIHTIATAIDTAAITVLEFGEHVVNVLTVGAEAWSEAIVIYDTAKEGLAGIVYMAEAVALGFTKIANVVTLGALDDQVKALETDMDHWYNVMAQTDKAIDDQIVAGQKWVKTGDAIHDKIEEIRQKMIQAQEARAKATAGTKEAAAADEAAAKHATDLANAEDLQSHIIKQTAEERKKYIEGMKELEDAGKGWLGTLQTIDGETVEAIKYYLDAGVAGDKLAAVYGLTATQIKAVETAHKEELAVIKAETDATQKLSEMYTAYYSAKAELEGTDAQKITSKAELEYEKRVDELQKMGVEDVSYYDQLWDLRNKDIALETQKRAESIEGTREHYSALARAAKNAYDDAVSGVGTYSKEALTELHQKMIEAQHDLDNWDRKSTTALEKAQGQVHTLSGEYISLAEAQERASGGGSTDVNRANLAQNAEYWHIPGSVAEEAAKRGFSFQEILQAWQSGLMDQWVPHGPKIAGFREGGIGDFGEGTLAMLHGHEAIIPLGSAGHGIGGITVHEGAFVFQYPVINDPRSLEMIGSLAGKAILHEAMTGGTIIRG